GNRTDVPELMGVSDAVILATHTEGLPIVLLEAMAAGTPIVATGIPACKEALDGGRCGLLVPPGDAVAMAASIIRLLDDSELRGQLTSAAQERVRRLYRVDLQVRRYAELLSRSC
ncbi:MAG: glycosyltransferase family 4 protein, partial [bacterium]|nr:glycosyltransferase family 4 protein [bacterium]